LQQASAKRFCGAGAGTLRAGLRSVRRFSGLSGPNAAVDTEPLHFTHVTATPRDANGMRVLLINGIIDNVSGTTQVVRPIRANLFADERTGRQRDDQPAVDVIYGGESRGFSTRVQLSRWKNAGGPAVLRAVRGVSPRRLW
jgi:hypothetical protein